MELGAKKPYVVAFLIQATYAGMVLLSKAAFNAGMNTSVFVFYRQLAGTLFMLPFAIILERKNPHPLSLAVFFKIFMLAFTLTLSLNVYGVALVYTSANLGATTINCLPVTTFAWAVLLRMEKVKLRAAPWPGIAKVGGMAVCMAGVCVFAFYKGPHIKPFVHFQLDDHDHDHDHHNHDHVSSAKRILGCFLLLVSSMCWGLWLVLQAQILKVYPPKLGFTTLQGLSSTIQAFLIAISFTRDPRDWKLAFNWNLRLLSVLYCGILVTGLTYYLQAWVVAKRGPVFLAMTTPLNLVMTILGSMFLLGEIVNLGSILGGILLVISLYSVLWGKSKEQDTEKQSCLPATVQDN